MIAVEEDRTKVAKAKLTHSKARKAKAQRITKALN